MCLNAAIGGDFRFGTSVDPCRTRRAWNSRTSGAPSLHALTPERAAEMVQRAGSGVPKALLARDYGISRETVYQYVRHAKLELTAPLRRRRRAVADAAVG